MPRVPRVVLRAMCRRVRSRRRYGISAGRCIWRWTWTWHLLRHLRGYEQEGRRAIVFLFVFTVSKYHMASGRVRRSLLLKETHREGDTASKKCCQYVMTSLLLFQVHCTRRLDPVARSPPGPPLPGCPMAIEGVFGIRDYILPYVD